MTQTLDATIAGKIFHPDAPAELKPNSRVRIRVESPNEDADEPQSFLGVALSPKLEGPEDWASCFGHYLNGETAESPDG